jgi:hypothetical protein
MKRQINQLVPFMFSSDFSVDREDTPAPDTMTISMEHLSSLLARTQETTAALVRDDALQAEAETLEQATLNLKTALAAIVQLAEQLEHAALSSEARSNALTAVRHIARTLVDGQADLFDQSRSQLRKHSDSR